MIRGLDALLSERRLVQTCPFSVLKDTRLGIDFNVYVRTLLQNPETSEPFTAAIGGSPLALISRIEGDLRTFEKARIKPVFVLSGLPPAKPTRPFSFEDLRPVERARAWDLYEEGQVEAATAALNRSNSIGPPDLIRGILRAFRHRNIEFIVAPYLAAGQLVYLERHPKGFIHSMYGTNALLLFDGVDKVILSLDFKKLTFDFVSKASVLAELKCNREELLDTALLLGFDFCPTFPPLLDGSAGPRFGQPGYLHPRSVADFVKQYRTGVNACLAFHGHPQVSRAPFPYLEQFCRARCLVKYSVVVSAEEGKVLPLPLALPTGQPAKGALPPTQPGGKPNPAAAAANERANMEIPSDLHEVFSHRLPDELFLHISRGLIAAQVIHSLTSGFVVEPPPLDNGETDEYKRFLKEVITENPQGPRCVAIALACSNLNGFWMQRKISAVYWYNPHVDCPIPHDSQSTQQLIARVNNWNVPILFIEGELRRQNSSTIDIALCVGATTSSSQAERTKTPRTTTTPALEKKDEIVANVIWRMLELRGFLNHDHLHTPFARGLYLALQQARTNDRFQEPLYVALELLRANVLHANWYSGRSLSGGPSVVEADSEKRSMLLVMRAFSLVPMVYKPEKWDAPLSRELLVFNSFVRSMTRSLRSLVEMIASSMLLRGDARRTSRDDYLLEISLSLPFTGDTNTGLGIVIKCFLEGLITFYGKTVTEQDAGTDEVKEAKEAVAEMLESTFENVKNVRNELGRGFRFWKALMTAVKVLAEEKSMSPETVAQFEAADKWLAPMSFA